MNKDSMPLLLYLLFAEALKQQSDRVIQQLGGGIDTTDIINNFSSVFSGIDFLKAEDVKIQTAQSANTEELSVIHHTLSQLSDSSTAFQDEERLQIKNIREAIEEMRQGNTTTSQNQLAGFEQINDSLETIKDKDGRCCERLEESIKQQAQAFSDLSSMVYSLNEKLKILDRIQDIDKLVQKVTELERTVSSRKRN